MNMILSRKGFDNKYGGYSNPILQNEKGKMVLLPIPAKANVSYKNSTYSSIFYDEGKDVQSLLNRLGYKIPSVFCHADPDINFYTYPNRDQDWRGLFGQCGSAEIFLRKQGVGSDDVFLFFGTFQKNPDEMPFHSICGYLQIGRRIDLKQEQAEAWMSYHPHLAEGFGNKHKVNSLYVAKKNQTSKFNESKPGYGCFYFDEKLRLTAKDERKKSIWDLGRLSSHFKDCAIEKSIRNACWFDKEAGIYDSDGMGQEFVIKDINDGLKEWLKSVLALPTYNQKP